MAQERLKPTPREFNFYGEGKAESINRGFAFSSLRNPTERYNFRRGEVILANCVDDGKKIPMVVVNNETKTLNDHFLPVLALDGFISPEHAAKGLNEGGYPGYENTTPESPMMAITSIKKRVFDSLPDDQKARLITEPIEDLLRAKEFRHLFFPRMCFHLADLGFDIADWEFFLTEQELISVDDAKVFADSAAYNANEYNFYLLNPWEFQKLSLTPRDIHFKPLILGIKD